MSNPTRVRDIEYPSQRAAARAHKVHPSTVRGALERGTIDNLGIGSNAATMRPVWVHFEGGFVLPFESQGALARWAGERPEHTRKRMRRAQDSGRDATIKKWWCTVHFHNPKETRHD